MPILKGDDTGAPTWNEARVILFSDEIEPEAPRQIAPPPESLGLGYLLTTSMAPGGWHRKRGAVFLGPYPRPPLGAF